MGYFEVQMRGYLSQSQEIEKNYPAWVVYSSAILVGWVLLMIIFSDGFFSRSIFFPTTIRMTEAPIIISALLGYLLYLHTPIVFAMYLYWCLRQIYIEIASYYVSKKANEEAYEIFYETDREEWVSAIERISDIKRSIKSCRNKNLVQPLLVGLALASVIEITAV